ncbi:hypothetical protein [Candidatus Regiella insecticola]|uniref:hypothetical protein n=1 Tax=Candidatus Regiella insecticola TaxID=138073 RepID=UPI0022A66ABD|nr:hypothetical protein [Candidatus Regiella insecticola]
MLAVEYAGWIRPDFRIIVNQTFIDYRRGNLTVVREKKNDYLAEFRQTRALKMAISSSP